MSDKRKNQKTDKFLILQDPAREKRADICLFFLLLAFGIYQAVIYWGHQPVPHFDFQCFESIGRVILNFEVPVDYKRLPLIGMLHILLGYITGGTYPALVGGWLLNSITHPLTVIFYWLAARKIIGRNAIWFAIIAIINPFGLQLLTEAIVETPMLFFMWVTFYLIFIIFLIFIRFFKNT